MFISIPKEFFVPVIFGDTFILNEENNNLELDLNMYRESTGKKNNDNLDNNIKYLVKHNPMTETERKFISYLKPFADKENLIILPQIPLQAIFKNIDKKDISSFNKIKSKTIDFAIVDNNYNYKLFIELDDYTHNRTDRIKRDIFVNNLFNIYNLKLKRIKVQNYYNLDELESIIKEVV